MTRPSESMDDLTGDLRHLSTLIGVITNKAIDIIDPDKQQCEQTKKELGELSDLLWIARDMVEQVADNGEACHRKAIAERNATKNGGSRHV